MEHSTSKLATDIERTPADLARALREAELELAQARDKLRVSEEAAHHGDKRLRDLIDGLGPTMFVGLMTPRGILIEANRPALAAAGLRPEDVLGRPFEDTYWWAYSPDVQQQLREAIARAADGEASRYDVQVRVAEHQFIDIDFSLQPLRDVVGDVVSLVPSARVIADRKLVENTLRDSEERFSGAFEHAPIGVALVAPDGRWLRVNRALCGLVGYSEVELLARRFQDITHPDDLDALLRNLHRILAGEIQSCQMEKRYVHARGHAVTVLLSLSLVRDRQDRPSYFIAHITERTLAERALQRRTEEFQTLAEAMPQIVWITGPGGANVYFNQRWMEYTGLTLEDSLGGGWSKPFHPDDQERARRAWKHATETIGLYSLECRLRRADGVYRWWLIRGVPQCAPTGDVANWFGTCTDIHDLKMAELEISNTNRTLQLEIVERQRAEQAADAANRSKSEFLANMSHEIRTPLNGVIGMTELALATDLTIEQREYLDMVKSSGQSLLSVINDILDFSKIEAGRLTVDAIPFDLIDCLSTPLKQLAAQAHEKGLELACDIRPDVPTALVGDPSRLRQILTNLMANAVKFTDQGEVVLTVEAEAQTDRGATLRFSVTDTGIGVPPEQQETIFEPFVQADGSVTRKYGGSGLGLAISTNLVALMGGRIWMESEDGQGSAFRFTVAFNRHQVVVSETRSRDEEMKQLRGVPVLVVDDNASTGRILDATLKRWLMKPELVASGQDSMAVLQARRRAGTAIPLVLLDAQMPGMDGFRVADAIRSHPELSATAIVMLISGRQGDGARCRALGVGAYLMKPIGARELLEAVLTALHPPTGDPDRPQAVSPQAERSSRRSLHILLAEDNRVNQFLATRLLGKLGHAVVVAATGREALAALADPGPRGFDLILMDVQMPDMDGFEATAIIRARERHSGTHVPIIAVTAHAMKGDEERCLAAGMDGYTSKPIDIDQLVAAIDRVT